MASWNVSGIAPHEPPLRPRAGRMAMVTVAATYADCRCEGSSHNWNGGCGHFGGCLTDEKRLPFEIFSWVASLGVLGPDSCVHRRHPTALHLGPKLGPPGQSSVRADQA